MPKYPDQYGMPKGNCLPDLSGPLKVDAPKGDKLVPQNDMQEVGGAFAKGTPPPDPNNFVKVIE